jgi:AcrR family transcriptional regulator
VAGGEQPTDRRQRRRRETVDEIVDVAAAIMAEHGAGGLSLGEVARRMGIRTPSLYGYFDSKNALYDALFARGWTLLNRTMDPHVTGLRAADDPAGHVLGAVSAFVRWAVEHPAYAQLMFWRPVPGFAPSPQAYAPALESMRALSAMVGTLRDLGVLRADVDVADAAAACAVLVSGVISQQLSNAPEQTFEQGTFTRLVPQLVALYLAGYGPEGEGHDRFGTSTGARGTPAAAGARRGSTGRDGAVRGVRRAAARSRRG